MKRTWTTFAVLAAWAILTVSVGARTGDMVPREPAGSALTPAYCNVAHNVGRIALGVSNDGTFGTNFSVTGSTIDCFTGEMLPTCE